VLPFPLLLSFFVWQVTPDDEHFVEVVEELKACLPIPKPNTSSFLKPLIADEHRRKVTSPSNIRVIADEHRRKARTR